MAGKEQNGRQDMVKCFSTFTLSTENLTVAKHCVMLKTAKGSLANLAFHTAIFEVAIRYGSS